MQSKTGCHLIDSRFICFMPPVTSRKEIKRMLFEYLCIDNSELDSLETQRKVAVSHYEIIILSGIDNMG